MLQSHILRHIERRLYEHQLPLALKLWDGRSIAAVDKPQVTLQIRSPKALSVLVEPTMGKLARSYVEQQIDVAGDSHDVIKLAESLSNSPAISRSGDTRGRSAVNHTRERDCKSVQQHYDVSDDFYGLWLDPQRVYSCAYFRRNDDTLERAQEQKLDLICRKLGLRPGERFLDIGCGWGALIMHAAEKYQVIATGITLSRNQYEYANRQIAERGLSDRCRVNLRDYRDLSDQEPFDKIASVGMFEHVGVANLPLYFSSILRLLRPGGLVLNHGITLNTLEQAELGSDIGKFIDDYVFPCGELTHISTVIAGMSRQGLECRDVENLRPHYAKTLWAWVEQLEANRERALELVGEKRYRVWRIYMAGAAHGFERGWMSVYQVLAGRPDAKGTLDAPMTRDHIYAH